MSDNPALTSGLYLKHYMDDNDPGQLHALLLHMLERVNKLEEANKFTREDLIKLEVQNDIEAMQEKADDAIRKAQQKQFERDTQEIWERDNEAIRKAAEFIYKPKSTEEENKPTNYKEFLMYLKGFKEAVEVLL